MDLEYRVLGHQMASKVRESTIHHPPTFVMFGQIGQSKRPNPVIPILFSHPHIDIAGADFYLRVVGRGRGGERERERREKERKKQTGRQSHFLSHKRNGVVECLHSGALRHYLQTLELPTNVIGWREASD